MPQEFPRPTDYKVENPDNADLSIEPYGTAAVANPRYGLNQGSITATGKGHDRDFEANTADGRVSREPGLRIGLKSGAGGEDAEPVGDPGSLDPYATARNPIPRGSINRVPN
jgi:hypothetical protein